MRQSVGIVVVCMLLTCAVVGACFVAAVLVIDNQVATNRHNGEITR